MKLGELASAPGVRQVVGDPELRLHGIASDSRRVSPGDVFAAISGGTSDGRAFAAQALSKGAVAVLCDAPLDTDVPMILVDDVRARLGPLAHQIYGTPTRTLKTFAVTGTNGKTTVTYLLESVLAQAGARPALLGTIAARGPAFERASELTTPEADVVARFAYEQLCAGATHLVMEASSHALSQHRLRGVELEVAAFTNLTQDHLDYHRSMEAYGEAKACLFTEFAPRTSVVMVDQPFGRALSRRAHGRVLRASPDPRDEAELKVRNYLSSRSGIEATLDTPWGPLSVHSPLFGAHNLENLLVTVGAALSLGLEPPQVESALRAAVGAPGRMERVPTTLDVMVLVDYAHTPDALRRALSALRPLTHRRLFVVCGCGGDRDPSKRDPMGEAAVRGADLTLLTSDNPRSEEPLAILRQMEVGARRVASPMSAAELPQATRGYLVMEDRAQAIRAAVFAAQPGDTVLIAGKGHETYQIVGRERRSFDDRLEAASALRARETS